MEMIGFQFDDGGRSAAGYKSKRAGDAGDCVARALSILLGGDERSYKRVYAALANESERKGGRRSARGGVKNAIWQKVYKNFGLVKVSLGRGTRPTYSEAHARFGDCIVSTTHHLAALKGGALRDTADGRTYWMDINGAISQHERKAMSIWVLEAPAL